MFLSSFWQKSCGFNAKILTAYWRYKLDFKIKMNNQHRFIIYLFHIGLMLTISKVFTILCLLCLYRYREYPGSFQNKSVSSSFKWLPKYILFLAKLKEEGRPFWSGQAKIYPIREHRKNFCHALWISTVKKVRVCVCECVCVCVCVCVCMCLCRGRGVSKSVKNLW